jgi:hypothetical protein
MHYIHLKLIILEGSNHIFDSLKSKFTIPPYLFAQVDVVSHIILDDDIHIGLLR